MNCLIFGAGFCGSNLAFHLSHQHKVTVFDNLVRRGSELNVPLFKDYDIEFIHGDIRNIEDLKTLGKFDIVLHTAAQPSACTGYSNPTFDITNNYIGTLNVLEYVRRTGAKMIFWSTNKVYSGELISQIKVKERKTRYEWDPNEFGISETFPVDGGNHSIYGVSKLCADLTCQEWSKAFNIPMIINRFSCLAGPGQWGNTNQGWVGWLVIATMLHKTITFYGFGGKQVRDILFVQDMLDLVDIQIKNLDKYRGEVINVGGGYKVNTSLIECLDSIGKLLTTGTSYFYNKEQRTADQCVYISDIRKAKKLFKWEPKVGMEDGLKFIIDWVNKNERELKKIYES